MKNTLLQAARVFNVRSHSFPKPYDSKALNPVSAK